MNHQTIPIVVAGMMYHSASIMLFVFDLGISLVVVFIAVSYLLGLWGKHDFILKVEQSLSDYPVV